MNRSVTSVVRMLGSMIASSAVRVMRESIEPTGTARIWAGQETFPCPGRVRLVSDPHSDLNSVTGSAAAARRAGQ
jgi:hypothetical protein